jgi:hypothetical protein
MVFMPKSTPNNNRVLIIRLIDFLPDNIVFEDALTVFTMVYDTAIVTREKEKLVDGEVLILDLNGFGARHLARLGLSLLRCFIKYMIEAHPIRITEVHIVNSHSLLDKIMFIAKPFLGGKAIQLIHFHSPNAETLYDFVPKDCLPCEYGGSSGPIDTPKWFWINRTDDHRQENWRKFRNFILIRVDFTQRLSARRSALEVC